MRKLYEAIKKYRNFRKAFRNAKFDFGGMFDSLATEED